MTTLDELLRQHGQLTEPAATREAIAAALDRLSRR